MKIAVFCGSSPGKNNLYREAADQLGRFLAAQGHVLVYGGGRTGLMGQVADSALAAGGDVVGVMPIALTEKEIQHPHLSELHIVADMHERKAKMAQLADAFIAMPGGVGTMEEIFEAWTWAQLGYHHKPCCFLNVNRYYDGLFTFIDTMISQGFMRPEYGEMAQISDDPAQLLAMIESYIPPSDKW